MSIEWVTPPAVLAQAVSEYEKRARVALFAAANAWGMQAQGMARLNAPWTDRTGNARTGLFYAVDGFGMGSVTGDASEGARGKMTDSVTISGDDEHLVIAVSHTVFYGKFLELKNGGNYAIILSTIEQNLPDLEVLIQRAYGH